jgi:hypothetical protein
MRPRLSARRRPVLAHPKRSFAHLDLLPGTPAGDEGGGQRGIEEEDGDACMSVRLRTETADLNGKPDPAGEPAFGRRCPTSHGRDRVRWTPGEKECINLSRGLPAF